MGNTTTTAVVVTGGASGIGLASAAALAEQGSNVALWDLNAEAAEGAAADLASRSGVAGPRAPACSTAPTRWTG